MFGSAASRDLTQIGKLLRDLEGHVAGLAQSAGLDKRSRSQLPEMIAEALSDVSGRLHSVQHSARNVGAEAARVGSGAWHRIEDEVVNRPLTALAIAAGIGFLIGALNRR